MAPSVSILTGFDFNNIENLGGRGGEGRRGVYHFANLHVPVEVGTKKLCGSP